MSKPLSKQILQALDTHYAEDPSRWSKGAWAKNKAGHKLDDTQIYGRDVVALCAEAGVRVFARKFSPDDRTAKTVGDFALKMLTKQLGQGFQSVPDFNDRSTVEGVRGLLQKTIAAL